MEDDREEANVTLRDGSSASSLTYGHHSAYSRSSGSLTEREHTSYPTTSTLSSSYHVRSHDPYTTSTTPTSASGVVALLRSRVRCALTSAFKLQSRSAVGGLTAQNVGDEIGVTDLLIGHKLNQEAILCTQARCLEVVDRELGQSIVEEVELYPLLVECQTLCDSEYDLER